MRQEISGISSEFEQKQQILTEIWARPSLVLKTHDLDHEQLIRKRAEFREIYVDILQSPRASMNLPGVIALTPRKKHQITGKLGSATPVTLDKLLWMPARGGVVIVIVNDGKV